MFEIIGGALLLNWLFPRKEVYVVTETKEPEVVYVPRNPIKEKKLTKKELKIQEEYLKTQCPYHCWGD